MDSTVSKRALDRAYALHLVSRSFYGKQRLCLQDLIHNPISTMRANSMSGRFVESLTQALRSVGLDFFNYLIWGRYAPEPTKVAINKSFWLAFGRCAVHLLPVAVSTYLVYLNLAGYYIGEHLSFANSDQADNVSLALIQVASKIQVTPRISQIQGFLTRHPRNF